MKIWTIKESDMYFITYAVKAMKYPVYLPIIQKLILLHLTS